ncbi:MAG: hypothetical protein ACP5OR_08500 [Candidatus Dormibacteria bacterium]
MMLERLLSWLRTSRLPFLIVGAAVVLHALVFLGSVPHGLYNDEASIGYNAWAIAHAGRDEHGVAFPLFFQAFGEWKNPVYIYTLALLLKVLPLTITTTRLPAALFGCITIFCCSAATLRLTGSRAGSLLMLAIGATNPWLTLLSRDAFEVISMVGFLSIAVAAAVWHPKPTLLTSVVTSTALGICTYGYSTGRLMALLFYLVWAVSTLWSDIPKPWRLLKNPIAWAGTLPAFAAYVLLFLWMLHNPTALVSRFNTVSIAVGGVSPTTILARFITNLLTYLSPGYLFVTGDQNLRQNTQYGGMLLIGTLPLLLAGVLVTAKHFRTSIRSRFLLLGLGIAPVAAALTEEGTPHALRSSDMLPFLLCLIGIGSVVLGRWCMTHRREWARALAVFLVLEAVYWNVDFFTGYALRSEAAFNTTEMKAVKTALHDAHGAPVWVPDALASTTTFASTDLGTVQPTAISEGLPAQMYIFAAFAHPIPPPATYTLDSTSWFALHEHLVIVPISALDAAPPGSLVVVPAPAAPPPHSILLTQFTITAPENATVDAPVTTSSSYAVYRIPAVHTP